MKRAPEHHRGSRVRAKRELLEEAARTWVDINGRAGLDMPDLLERDDALNALLEAARAFVRVERGIE